MSQNLPSTDDTDLARSAFNAIISASVVALGVSYGMPILINVMRGRKMVEGSPWKMPEPVAWIVNIVSFCFPSFIPVLVLQVPEVVDYVYYNADCVDFARLYHPHDGSISVPS